MYHLPKGYPPLSSVMIKKKRFQEEAIDKFSIYVTWLHNNEYYVTILAQFSQGNYFKYQHVSDNYLVGRNNC